MSAQPVPSLDKATVIPDTQVLDRSLVRGVAWTSAAKAASQLMSWAATLVVARLLTPQDYGLVGMAAVFLGLITLLSEFGFGSAIVALRQLNEDQVAQLNGLSLLFGLAGFGISCAAAVPLGYFFGAPELPAVIVVTAIGFLITAFRMVPSSLLQRDLQFKSLAMIESGRALVLAVSMIALALFGFRYWTLVIGGLLSAVLGTGAILTLRRHRFAWPRLGTIRQAMTFSGHVFLSRLSWYTYSNADFLVAGRVLGKTALGFYELGWTLASIPIDKVTALVTQVTPPIFSAVQHDLAALRRYVLKITEGLAFITYPLCFGMALVAPEFVQFALGPKWLGAIVPLQILAVSAGFNSVTPLLPQVLLAIGRSHVVMKYGVVTAVVLPLGFYLFSQIWGIVGIALTWVIVFPLLAVPAYGRALAAIQLPVREYVRSLWPAFSASLIMVATLVVLKSTVELGWSAGARFGTHVAVGATVYAATCLTLHRSRITRFYSFLRAQR